MKVIMCHARLFKSGAPPTHCSRIEDGTCPLRTRKFRQLLKEPCYKALWIPTRFLTATKNDKQKAARLYLEEACLLE